MCTFFDGFRTKPYGYGRGFKAWRALAIKFVIEGQAAGSPEFRLKEPALLLTAGCSWLLNSLNATPDVRSASRELIEAIFPRVRKDEAEDRYLPYPMALPDAHEEEEGDDDDERAAPAPRRTNPRNAGIDDDVDDDGEGEDGLGHQRGVTTTAVFHPNRHFVEVEDQEEAELATLVRGEDLVPHVPFGVFFLRELKLDNVPIPRLRYRRIYLSDRAFKLVFEATRDEVSQNVRRSTIIAPSNPERLANKTRQVLLPRPPTSALPLNFDLQAQGFELEPMPVDNGSDVDSDVDEDQPDDLADGLDVELDRLCSQFFRDLISLSPNRGKGRDSPYTKVPKHEFDKTTVELFQELDLDAVWTDAQVARGGTAEWKKNFDNLFPPKDVQKSGSTQNFKLSAYYVHWEKIKNRLSDDAAKAARKMVFRVYNQMEWAPYTYTWRIWQTRSDKGGFKKPSGIPGAAPQLLVKPGAAVRWVRSDVLSSTLS